MLAKHALSQLSYGPILGNGKGNAASAAARVALAALRAERDQRSRPRDEANRSPTGEARKADRPPRKSASFT